MLSPAAFASAAMASFERMNAQEEEQREQKREKVRAAEHVDVEEEACDYRQRPPTGVGDAERVALLRAAFSEVRPHVEAGAEQDATRSAEGRHEEENEASVARIQEAARAVRAANSDQPLHVDEYVHPVVAVQREEGGGPHGTTGDVSCRTDAEIETERSVGQCSQAISSKQVKPVVDHEVQHVAYCECNEQETRGVPHSVAHSQTQ